MATEKLEIERLAKLEAQVDAIKEDVADVKSDIKDLHSRITTTTREITDHIDDKIDTLAQTDAKQHEGMKKSIDSMKDRVDMLEKWKWLILGGATAVGYILGHLEFFSRFVK